MRASHFGHGSGPDNFRAAILAALGYAPELIEPGCFQRFSTADRVSDRAGWSVWFPDRRAGAFGDFRSGVSLVWAARRSEPITPAVRAEMAQQLARAKTERETRRRQQHDENARRNAALWANAMPVSDGDPVALYLRRRRLTGPVPECLRLHPRLTYWDDGDRGAWPAMLAPLMAPDGRVLALHRTYLTMDGYKAPVPIVKKLTRAAGPLAGASIPLHEPQYGVVGIAEGIETALAAQLASGVPTVAAYCAGNLAAWKWPRSAQRLVIFADNDRAGREAADELRGRALAADLRCEVLTPSDEDADWCDAWAAHGSTAINRAAR